MTNKLEDIISFVDSALENEKQVKTEPGAFALAFKALQSFYNTGSQEFMKSVDTLTEAAVKGDEKATIELIDYVAQIKLGFESGSLNHVVSELLQKGLTDEVLMKENIKNYEDGFKNVFKMLKFFYHPDHAEPLFGKAEADEKFKNMWNACEPFEGILKKAAAGNKTAVKQIIDYARKIKPKEKQETTPKFEKLVYKAPAYAGQSSTPITSYKTGNLRSMAEQKLRQASYDSIIGDYKNMFDHLREARSLATTGSNNPLEAQKLHTEYVNKARDIANSFMKNNIGQAKDFITRFKEEIYPGSMEYFENKIEGANFVNHSEDIPFSPGERTSHDNQIRKARDELRYTCRVQLTEEKLRANPDLRDLLVTNRLYQGIVPNFDTRGTAGSRLRLEQGANTPSHLLNREYTPLKRLK
jgi:hypothetical protein